MKKFKILLSIVLLLFISCDSSSDNDVVNEKSYDEIVLGTWQLEFQWQGIAKTNDEDWIKLRELPDGHTEDGGYMQWHNGECPDDCTTQTYGDSGFGTIAEWGYPPRSYEYYIQGKTLYARYSAGESYYRQTIHYMTSNYFIASKYNQDDYNNYEVRGWRRIESAN